jgi:hypothetical protein
VPEPLSLAASVPEIAFGGTIGNEVAGADNSVSYTFGKVLPMLSPCYDE